MICSPMMLSNMLHPYTGGGGGGGTALYGDNLALKPTAAISKLGCLNLHTLPMFRQ